MVKVKRNKYKNKNISRLIINPMSQEQEILGSMFGNGDKVLTGGEDSLPKISGALMPHSFGDELESETSETFGFGINKYRSGLF